MQQTARTDSHERPVTAVAAAPMPHEGLALRESYLGMPSVGTGFAARIHGPSAPVPVLATVPLRTRCWKAPRAGPRAAACMAEVPKKRDQGSRVSKSTERR